MISTQNASDINTNFYLSAIVMLMFCRCNRDRWHQQTLLQSPGFIQFPSSQLIIWHLSLSSPRGFAATYLLTRTLYIIFFQRNLARTIRSAVSSWFFSFFPCDRSTSQSLSPLHSWLSYYCLAASQYAAYVPREQVSWSCLDSAILYILCLL